MKNLANKTVINYMYSRKIGGLERASINYAKALADAGVKVIMFVHKKCKYLDELEKLPIQIEKFSHLYKFNPLTIFQKRRAINKINPDLIICHTDIEWLLRANTKHKLTMVYHGYEKIKYAPQISSLAVLTEDMKSYAIKQGFSKQSISIIPNMVKVPQKMPEFTWQQPLSLGFCGRLTGEKGLDILLKSCAILRDKYQLDFKLTIAGEGNLKSELEQLSNKLNLQKQISFIGWIEITTEFYKAVDIQCMPSLEETFGLVGIEAMANNVPLIASGCAGMKSYLRNGENGILLEKNTPEELTERIYWSSQHQDKIKAMAQQAFSDVKNNFSVEVINQKIVKLL